MDFLSRHYTVLDSTNIEAERLIKGGNVNEGIVLYADFQEGGKGQGGNSWHSIMGQNLLFSLILKPAFLSADKQFYLSKVVSLAICDYLSTYDLEACIKWPNDILVSGRKIAGILIENRLMGKGISHSIVGVGLNVNQTDFPSFPWEAGSIAQYLQTEWDIESVLRKLLIKIDERYQQLHSGNFTRIDCEFLTRLYRINERVEFKGSEGLFTAKMLGVNETGEILLELNGAARAFGFHEVRYAPPG